MEPYSADEWVAVLLTYQPPASLRTPKATPPNSAPRTSLRVGQVQCGSHLNSTRNSSASTPTPTTNDSTLRTGRETGPPTPDWSSNAPAPPVASAETANDTPSVATRMPTVARSLAFLLKKLPAF